MNTIQALVALSIFSIAAGSFSAELTRYARLNSELANYHNQMRHLNNATEYLKHQRNPNAISSAMLNDFFNITDHRSQLQLRCTRNIDSEYSNPHLGNASRFQLIVCALSNTSHNPLRTVTLLRR